MFAMTPRYLSVLGRPESLGTWIGHESITHRVPHRALFITAGCVLALSLAAGLTDLVAFSAVAVLTQYGVTTAALVALAWRRRNGLKRWQLWPAPLALVAVVGIGQTAEAMQLLVAAAVLLLGGILLVVRRLIRRAA
jgi:APA family basic amino acid/polyamine antiporter